MEALFTGAFVTPKILGNSDPKHTLLVMENKKSSVRFACIRRLTLQMDSISTLSVVMPLVKVGRVSNMSLNPMKMGVTVTKTAFDTSMSSVEEVVLRCSGTGGDNIPVPLDINISEVVWQQYTNKGRSGAEQYVSSDNSLLPWLVEFTDFVLSPGESLVVQVVSTVGTSNPATNTWFVQGVWEEYEVEMVDISGNVSSSGSPVNGATVTVVVSDDSNMTNSILWSVVTTNSQGMWTARVPRNKNISVYSQYKNGSTTLSSTGSPYNIT